MKTMRLNSTPRGRWKPNRSAAAIQPGTIPTAFAAAGLILAGGLAAGLAVGQPAPDRDPAPGIPGIDAGTMGGGERLEDTLAKCLADLRSEDPETRRAAVLLLGKYEVPAARAALIEALRDPVAAVRRATVVSIFESIPGLMMAAPALLPLLGDDDVHIRRMISSRLPELAIRGLTAMQAPPAGPSPAPPPPAVVAALRQAFADPDETVRHNMLSAYRQVQAFVDPDVVPPFLRETNPALRVLALQTLWRSQPAAEVIPVVLFLATDPEPEVRLQLVRGLTMHPAEQSGGTLLALIADPVAAVAGEAVLAALRGGVLVDRQPIADYLLRPDADRALGARILATLSGTAVPAVPLLRDMLRHPVPEFRAAAIQALARRGKNEIDTAALIALMDDPAPEVRRGAGQAVTQHGLMDPDTLRQLAASTYPDVRELLVPASRRLGIEPAVELLDELLIDERPAIRGAVIAEFARRQLPGWIEIIGRALLDGSPDVRQTARTTLMQRRPAEARPWVERAIERVGDERERDQLRHLLRLLGMPQPPHRGGRLPPPLPPPPPPPPPPPMPRSTP